MGLPMAVFRWGNAWDAFQNLEREMDSVLSSVLQGLRFGSQYPCVNLYEAGDAFVLTAELAGTRPEDLDLTVANGILTLKGKLTGPPNVPDEAFRRQERPRGTWQRTLSLPAPVLEDQVGAEFSHGVLTIRLPKASMSPPRQIPVFDSQPVGFESSGERRPLERTLETPAVRLDPPRPPGLPSTGLFPSNPDEGGAS